MYNIMHSFDEIGLIPATISYVKSRKEVCPFNKGKLPIFVSPMTCLLNKDNFKTFLDSTVIPIYPIFYNETLQDRLKYSFNSWIAVSLKEFEENFVKNPIPIKNTPYKILIDCAQGQMFEIFELAKKAKERYKNSLILMSGNIANEHTYIEYCKAGIDYVRVGIGGGSGCLSSVLTGMHVSLPDLIVRIKNEQIAAATNPDIKCLTKIIADGGINSISKIMKALALGADYVMIGSMFSNCEESCNTGYYYGQASEQGQIDRFGELKTEPEGCSIKCIHNTTLSKLTKKIEDILRSTMSYAGAFILNEFIGNVDYRYQTINEFNSYNK